MKWIIIIILVLIAVCFGARIEQADVSRNVAFVAVDATDYVTRETSLTNTAVYYSIDGGTATVMTTPATTALDATNMPGVFKLLIDEAGMVTLGTGIDESELVLHITADGMADVTLAVEVFRNAANVTEWLGTAVATPTVAGVPAVDMTHISGDSTAADNLEAAFTLTTIADIADEWLMGGSLYDMLDTSSSTNIPLIW